MNKRKKYPILIIAVYNHKIPTHTTFSDKDHITSPQPYVLICLIASVVYLFSEIPNHKQKNIHFPTLSSFSFEQQQLINTKESLRELVLEAESIVLQNINDRTSKTEYFFNEIIATKSPYRRSSKKMMEKSSKDTAKINRVQVS